MAHIRIVDVPCGYGKSSQILRSFDKQEKYIAVVPYLSEVDRFVEDAHSISNFCLTKPVAGKAGKRDHCEKLVRAGKSIACTHALFYRLGTIATQATDAIVSVDFDGVHVPTITIKHLLDDYNLIIDEVVDPFEPVASIRPVDFDKDYVGLGMAVIHPDGRVEPTASWDQRYREDSKTFQPGIYEQAKSGALYKVEDGLFVLTIPVELLLRPKSVTIYTYLSGGSILLQFLHKLQEKRPGEFTLDVDKLPTSSEAEWRADVAGALTIMSIPGLEDVRWNYSAQLKSIKTHRECAKVANALRNLRGTDLGGVDLNSLMLTSARTIWFASKTGEKPRAGRLAKLTRMFGNPLRRDIYREESGTYEPEWSTSGARFVPNTTRGTNEHSGCTHAIYLYDQHPNPQLLTFLGMKRNSREGLAFSDAYALTELVQWLFRSAIRVGANNSTQAAHGPRRKVIVYIPSQRMRNLLVNWLATGEVSSAKPRTRNAREKAMLETLVSRQEAA